MARDGAAVVRIERAFSKPGDHTQSHQAENGRHQPGHDRSYTRPGDADDDDGAMPKFISQVSARELRQHVSREEHAAYQSAHGVRVVSSLDNGKVVIDYVTDDRSGDGAVGG